jgi:hypothetical protein
MMYTELELSHVQETLRTLQKRIMERLPGSSLGRVAAELCPLAVLDVVNDSPVPAQK